MGQGVAQGCCLFQQLRVETMCGVTLHQVGYILKENEERPTTSCNGYVISKVSRIGVVLCQLFTCCQARYSWDPNKPYDPSIREDPVAPLSQL